ncbi:hypothetical protein [Enterococcus sp.]|uniref:hypothetical protein n=1 Tax=Enterococcus sp. TaxID=35783 RepID=UPI00290EF0F1|nr:hypothetical protein [Enterococcus sp.]MDU5336813.1 hypothetical protein [Enterococcus sp.]
MDLIREVYLSAEKTNTMCQYLPYFQDYFSVDEWESLIKRLYGNRSQYFAQTIEARIYKGFLEQEGTLDNRIEGLVYRVEAIFEGEDGKKHKLTIRETDPTIDEELTINILNILTTLSIFKVEGGQKFATYVSYKTQGTIIATSNNSRQKPQKAADEKETVIAAAQVPQPEKVQKQSVPSNKEEVVRVPLVDRKPEQGLEESTDFKNTVSNKKSPSSALPKDDIPPKNSNEPNNRSTDATEKKKKTAAKPDTANKGSSKSVGKVEKKRNEKETKRRVDRALGKRKNRHKKKR